MSKFFVFYLAVRHWSWFLWESVNNTYSTTSSCVFRWLTDSWYNYRVCLPLHLGLLGLMLDRSSLHSSSCFFTSSIVLWRFFVIIISPSTRESISHRKVVRRGWLSHPTLWIRRSDYQQNWIHSIHCTFLNQLHTLYLTHSFKAACFACNSSWLYPQPNQVPFNYLISRYLPKAEGNSPTSLH